MNVQRPLMRALLTGVALMGVSFAGAHAQRGGGAGSTPPARVPTGTSASLPPGTGPNRFMNFVFANPMPGKDAEFDDWYGNQHVPDLLEHPGYYAAQRFRLVEPGSFSHSRLVIWHIEGDRELSGRYVGEALQTGKTRRSDAFNWTPGASLGGTFEPISARVTAAGATSGTGALAAGKKRYVYFEFVNPVAGKEMLFSAQADRRVKDVVTVPGWTAGQRFKNLALPAPPAAPAAPPAPAAAGATPPQPPSPPPPPPGASRLPRYLTVYDLETANPKAALEALTQAVKAGKVRANNTVEPGTPAFFLEPISPFIRREDWHPPAPSGTK